MVVPTYNERENVAPLAEEVLRAQVEGLVLLFVDDSSPDGTGEELARLAIQRPWIRVHARNGKLGIGSAYQDGFKVALSELSADIVVEMDADFQHPPSGIPALVRAVQEGADVAVGSRYVPGGSVVGWGLWRRAVSRGANSYARLILGLTVKDSTSGFRAYSRRAAEIVSAGHLPAKGFEFQVASLRALKTGMKIVEIPYQFSARRAGSSKLGLKDVAKFFVAVLRLSFS